MIQPGYNPGRGLAPGTDDPVGALFRMGLKTLKDVTPGDLFRRVKAGLKEGGEGRYLSFRHRHIIKIRMRINTQSAKKKKTLRFSFSILFSVSSMESAFSPGPPSRKKCETYNPLSVAALCALKTCFVRNGFP